MAPGIAASPAAAILEASALALERWEEKLISIDDFLEHHLPCPEYRRSVSAVVFLYFRHKRFIDTQIERRTKLKPQPGVLRIVQMALTQAFFSTAISQPVAVSVAVDSTRAQFGDGAAKLVNALLRRTLEDAPLPGISPHAVLPPLVYTRWKELFPKKIGELTKLFTERPPFTCRDIGDFHLDCDKFEAKPIDIGAPYRFYIVGQPGKLLESEELTQGEVYVQDPTTAMAVGFLELTGSEKVCDLCAAPGGKSLMIAERLNADGYLLATDASERRLQQLEENFKCRNVAVPYKIEALAADAVKGSFDAVLCDVPCSNTGVYRRRPDALWRFNLRHQEELCKTQMGILTQAAKLVLPGGKLVYSTCSIDPAENGMLVADFLKKDPSFSLVKQRQNYPDRYCDGAYAALLIKKK